MGNLKQTRFVCLDVESTGLNPADDRVIEVAVVIFSIEEGIVESFETLIDPQIAVPEASMAIHNITPSMLVGKPTIEKVMPSLWHLIDNHIIVGHQIQFDITILAHEAKRNNIATRLLDLRSIDTLRLARSYGDSPNNSLVQLAKHFNVGFEDKHRAMSDVMMNVEVFKHLVHRYKTTEELFALLAQPIKMKYMPLGKYKGRLFSELPLSYLRWAAKMDFDQDLLYSLRSELKKRKFAPPSFAEASNPFKNL